MGGIPFDVYFVTAAALEEHRAAHPQCNEHVHDTLYTSFFLKVSFSLDRYYRASTGHGRVADMSTRNYVMLSDHRNPIVSTSTECTAGAFSGAFRGAFDSHSRRSTLPCASSRHETKAMKSVTVDMLRAHLMAAALTAMATEVLALVGLLALPVSQQVFSSTTFQFIALALIVSGVLVMRQFAHAAFDLAIQSHHATPAARPVLIEADCPRRWFVILHLRFTGRAFVLAGH
jgi:hypothetical protein